MCIPPASRYPSANCTRGPSAADQDLTEHSILSSHNAPDTMCGAPLIKQV